MKLNMGHVLRDFHGSALREDPRVARVVQLLEQAIQLIPDENDRAALIKQAEAVQSELTLWHALTVVAGSPIEGLTPEEMGRVFTVVCKLPKQGEAELDAKDVVVVQKAVGKVYRNPLYIGQLNALLEGKDPFA